MASIGFYIKDPDNQFNWLQLKFNEGFIWLEESGGEGMEIGEDELYRLLRYYYDGQF